MPTTNITHAPPDYRENKQGHAWISLHLKRVFTEATILQDPCNFDFESNIVFTNAELEEQDKQVELHLIQEST